MPRPLALLLLLACAKDPPAQTGDTGGATGPGTLRLSFAMDADLIPTMAEAASGTFRGSVYAEADASAVGPNDGAVALFDFEAPGIAMDAGGEDSAVALTTEPLDAAVVWVLGCLDTAGDDCECGDPITIPNENKVAVPAATETPITVTMSLLHPC